MKKCWMISGLLTMFYSVVWADVQGDNLAKRVYDRPNGKDLSALVTMTLTEKEHAPRVRSMAMYRLDGKSGEVSNLIRFLQPADIEGTGLLTLDLSAADANQWIYVPAMKRVRRIESGRKNGRFVNSDYIYEDLRDRKVAMDAHRVIGKESIGGVMCEILESMPVAADNSSYLKKLSWIDSETSLPLRVDFFDKLKDAPSKRLLVNKREKIQNYWTVTDSTLTDLVTGHQTRLVLEKVIYDKQLPERLFTTQALEDERIEFAVRPQ